MCDRLYRFWQTVTIDRLPTSSAHLNTQLVNAIIQSWSENTLLTCSPGILFAAKVGQLGSAIVSLFRSDIHPLPKLVHGAQGIVALGEAIVAGMMFSQGLTCTVTDYTQLSIVLKILDPIYKMLLTAGSLIVNNPATATNPPVNNTTPPAQTIEL